MVFYAAVVRGRKPGIYTDWDEYQEQVKGFSRALHMGFRSEEEANDFLNRSKDGIVDKRERKSDGITQSSAWEECKKNNETNFQFDESGNIEVYTAGFCPTSQRGVAGFGVFFGKKSPLNFSGHARGEASQHSANIQALTHALKTVVHEGLNRVVIFTSSQYVIDCMTHYVFEWKKQNWKPNENGQERSNKEVLLDLDKATEGIKVTYRYVAGGSGQHKFAKELAEKGVTKNAT